MKAYLISFRAKTYCQGWEDTYETLLVYADSFEEACDKVRCNKDYKSPNYFQNLTIL